MQTRTLVKLSLILLLAAILRFGIGLRWDDGQLLHPDERFLTMVAEQVRLPSSLVEYLDASTNPLSPYNNGHEYYVYGTLPLTLTRLAAEVVGLTIYDNIFLVGRVMSGLADIATIAGAYVLGAALYSTSVGLLGALFLALSVQNIQLSHFMGTENFVAAFIVWAAIALVKAGRSFQIGNAAHARLFIMGAGLLFGCALASKISALFFLPIVGCALLGGIFLLVNDYYNQIRIRSVCLELTVGAFILFCAAALIAFRIGQPSAFEGLTLLPGERFLDNMKKIKELTDGGEWPPNVQYAGRVPILYSLEQLFKFEAGFGWALAAFGGLFVATIDMVRRRRYSHFIPVAWSLFFFLYQSTRFVKFGRYLSIIYPFLAVLAGYFIVVLWNSRNHRLVARTLSVALVTWTIWWTCAFSSIYFETHTRIRASRWIYAHLPQGSAIMNEAWDDSLPLRIDGKDGYGGLYRDVQVNLYEPDTERKLDELMGALTSADYISLSSNRAYGSIPRLPKRYPMTRHYYRMLFSGQLGFELAHEETQYPSFLGFSVDTNRAIESFSVYDHPKVMIFKKTDRFDAEFVRQRLSNLPPGEPERLLEATVDEVSWMY